MAQLRGSLNKQITSEKQIYVNKKKKKQVILNV